MRTTITFEDAILAKAQAYTGIKEKSALVNKALEVLVAREAARQLALLGGKDPKAKRAPRRRTKPK